MSQEQCWGQGRGGLAERVIAGAQCLSVSANNHTCGPSLLGPGPTEAFRDRDRVTWCYEMESAYCAFEIMMK